MVKYRIALAGQVSRLREIIESIIEDQSDMAIVDEIYVDLEIQCNDKYFFHKLSKTIQQKNANVIIIDLSATNITQPGMNDNHGEKEVLNSVINDILMQNPHVVMIYLSALGKRMNIHSEINMDDIGVNQLVNAIRTLGGESINIIYQ